MPEYTTNYGLIKPKGPESFNINTFNQNSDTVDTELKKANDAIQAADTKADGKAPIVHTHEAADITEGVIAAARLPAATTGQPGITTLNNTVISTSPTQAATAAAVKQAYDRFDTGLLAQAGLSAFINPRKYSATFSSSGSWTCPAGVTQIDVWIVGGGGGGASGISGGGAGGGMCRMLRGIHVSPGTVYPITIGQGGPAGNVGGTSSAFGYTATGGKAGNGSNGGDGGNGGGAGVRGLGGTGGSNGTQGQYDAGRGLCSTLNPYDGKRYAGAGGGGYGGFGGFADIGQGGDGGQSAAAPNGSPGADGGGGGGGGGYGGSNTGLGGTGGKGIVAIYY